MSNLLIDERAGHTIGFGLRSALRNKDSDLTV